MVDLLKDLSTITTISNGTLISLANDIEDCICYDVCESINDAEYACFIDTGIGQLRIECTDDEIKYKFVPSHRLENKLKKTIETGKSPIEDRIDKEIRKRTLRMYKELL